MADAELIPVEETESVEGEEDYLAKLKEYFGADMDIVNDTDVRRIIRGYATEKEPWKEMVEKMTLWIAALKEDFANVGFKPMENQEMYKNMKEWAQFTVFGQDKFGHPVMYENVATYKCAEITDNLEQALIYRRRVFSQMWNKKFQESKKSGKMIYKQINIFNLNNIGVMSANKFKNVLTQMIKVEGDLFPETVYKMYFINTGFWFKAAWAVVSMFVHPATKKKIQFCGSDFISRIAEDVAAEQIPKEFGGKCESKLVWGETHFDEPAVAQFPDLLDALTKEGEGKKAIENAEAGDAEPKAQTA